MDFKDFILQPFITGCAWAASNVSIILTVIVLGLQIYYMTLKIRKEKDGKIKPK